MRISICNHKGIDDNQCPKGALPNLKPHEQLPEVLPDFGSFERGFCVKWKTLHERLPKSGRAIFAFDKMLADLRSVGSTSEVRHTCIFVFDKMLADLRSVGSTSEVLIVDIFQREFRLRKLALISETSEVDSGM